MASAAAIMTGAKSRTSKAAPARSKLRLTANSTPSSIGGLSSNRGSVWPGTNSARSMRISIVEGATRTLTPWW